MENTLLNLVPASYLPEVHLSQYDVGRELKFTLKDGSSDYTVPSGAVVTVKATKPSGLGFVVNATAEGSVVTLSNTETMTNENGRFPAELSITQGSTVIGTSNFIFNIERSPHPEGTIDGDAESLLPELTLLVERIEAAADSVDADTQIVTDAKAEVLQAKADTLQAKADTLSAKADVLQAKADTITAKESAEASAQAAEEASETAEELIGSVSTKADAIVKTASGEIASFTDGGDDLPMKSLKVNIVPKQSGSGDPSPDNVRPIEGWSGVEVNRTGVNIWDEEWENGLFNTTTGVNINTSSTNTQIRTKNYVPVQPSTTYYFEANPNIWVLFFDANKNPVPSGASPNYAISGNSVQLGSGGVSSEKTFTTPSNARYMRFYCQASYGNTYNNDISINYPSTDTSYHSGKDNESKSISLGQTVYGGVLDVVSGKLTLTRKTINLGDFSYELDARYSNNQFHRVLNDAKYNSTATLLCSQYNPRITSWGQNYNFSIGIVSWNLICVDNRYETSSAFRSGVDGVMLCYELATPIEIRLTPTEVKTLLGNNNIWSDSGSVEVEYRADTTLAYNELLALILENIGN